MSKIHGRCILMFAEPVTSIHRAHRCFCTVFNLLPPNDRKLSEEKETVKKVSSPSQALTHVLNCYYRQTPMSSLSDHRGSGEGGVASPLGLCLCH